jgi:hypothetical protein
MLASVQVQVHMSFSPQKPPVLALGPFFFLALSRDARPASAAAPLSSFPVGKHDFDLLGGLIERRTCQGDQGTRARG